MRRLGRKQRCKQTKMRMLGDLQQITMEKQQHRELTLQVQEHEELTL